MNQLSLASFQKMASADNTIIIDTRPVADFAAGFIPNSIFIANNEQLPLLASLLLNPMDNVLLVTTFGEEEHIEKLLTKAGFAHIEGCLKGGLDAWKKKGLPIDLLIDVDAYELGLDLPHDDNLLMVDVRSAAEFDEGHIKNAYHMPVNELKDLAQIAVLPEHTNIYIYCSNSERSATACSIMKLNGIHNMRWVSSSLTEVLREPSIKKSTTKSKLN